MSVTQVAGFDLTGYQKIQLLILALLLILLLPLLQVVIGVAVDFATFVALLVGSVALLSSAYSAQIANNIKKFEANAAREAARNLVVADVEEVLQESQRIIENLCLYEREGKDGWNSLVDELSTMERHYERRHDVSMFLSTHLSAQQFLAAQGVYHSILRMLRYSPRLLISQGTSSEDVPFAITGRKKILCEDIKRSQLELLEKCESLEFIKVTEELKREIRNRKGKCSLWSAPADTK